MSDRQAASQRAEESVIGALMRSEEARLEILTGTLESSHLFYRPYRLAFEEIVERFYADDPIDPLSIAEAIGPAAAKAWGTSEREAIDKLISLSLPNPADALSVKEHARIIRQHHDYRELTRICGDALKQATEQDLSPEDIAGALSAAATRVVTGSMLHQELISYAELGSRWTKATREEIAARQAGVDLGAFFGLKALDGFIKGLRPTELMILGGRAGVGKTSLAMTMMRNFSRRQLRKDPEKRIGVLYLSLEMGEKNTADRFAQMEARIDGERLRLGTITREELRAVAEKWAKNRHLKIVTNFSGELRQSQIKALCVDAIRRHDVGLVIIDHFRLIKTDERFEKANEADEEVVKFLKATLAKDLNLAVICLAHTVKGEERRPVMDDLRGSGMISAYADIVAFPHSPWRQATQEQRERGQVAREEIEVIFDKVRSSATGVGELWVDLSTMQFTDNNQ